MFHTARISYLLDLSTQKVLFGKIMLVSNMRFASVMVIFLLNLMCVPYEGESEEALDKTYYVFLPPELCFVHPLPGSLVRGAQRLPSIMRRVESMLLSIQLKHIIQFPVPASKV